MADEPKIHHEGSPYDESKIFDDKRESVTTQRKRSSVFDIGPDSKLNTVLQNPLASVEPEQIRRDVEEFCQTYGLMEYVEVIKKGALVARDPPHGPEGLELTEEESDALIDETHRKWHNPWML